MIHPVLEQLYIDHCNFQRILQCLKRQLRCYMVQDEETVDLPLILEILDYIHTYPEKWHHPVENKLFAILQRKRLISPDLIIKAQAEHKAMEKFTQELSQIFCSIANDCIVSVKHLVKRSEQYICQQVSHIQKENDYLFPLIDSALNEDDWAKVEREVLLETDPLFGVSVRTDYENLCKNIINDEDPSMLLSHYMTTYELTGNRVMH